jgi:hypothetical protein
MIILKIVFAFRIQYNDTFLSHFLFNFIQPHTRLNILSLQTSHKLHTTANGLTLLLSPSNTNFVRNM